MRLRIGRLAIHAPYDGHGFAVRPWHLIIAVLVISLLTAIWIGARP